MLTAATASWPLSYRLVGDNPVLAREFSGLLTSCGFLPLAGERSPVTIVTRSLSGESQLTRWLVTVPLDSVPTTATRSSCWRPLLYAVPAATEV